MRIFIAVMILFSAQLTLAVPTTNECRRFFNYPDGTNSFISYVESIADQPNIKRDLSLFYQSIIHGHIANPVSLKLTKTSAEMQIHRAGIQTILESSYLDLQKLKSWAAERSSQVISEAKKRLDVERVTERPTRQMKFVPVSEKLMMMDGPVTQHMWAEVFSTNPAHGKNGDEALILKINGESIKAQPEHPVEMVNFWSAILFANEMSKRMGLPEAYELSGIRFAGVNPWSADQDAFVQAGLGELTVEDQLSLDFFISENKLEKVVARSGLRLPTLAEVEYLVYHKARFLGVPLEQLNEKQLVALLNQSTENSHAVGANQVAAVINNQRIYDLIGNVFFWLTPKNIAPYGPQDRLAKSYGGTVWGASFGFVTLNQQGIKTPERIKSPETITQPLNRGNWNTGLILVRTVKP